jgi:hypothetical protein
LDGEDDGCPADHLVAGEDLEEKSRVSRYGLGLINGLQRSGERFGALRCQSSRFSLRGDTYGGHGESG